MWMDLCVCVFFLCVCVCKRYKKDTKFIIKILVCDNNILLCNLFKIFSESSKYKK